jgi:hypothetical protein
MQSCLRAINEVLATMTVDDYEAMMNEAISVQPWQNKQKIE